MQNIVQEKKIKERYISFLVGNTKDQIFLIFVVVEEVKYRSEKERDEDEERRWWKERRKEEKCDDHTLRQPHLVCPTMTRATCFFFFFCRLTCLRFFLWKLVRFSFVNRIFNLSSPWASIARFWASIARFWALQIKQKVFGRQKAVRQLDLYDQIPIQFIFSTVISMPKNQS